MNKNKILENIYGSKEYDDIHKRLYEEEQKRIYNSIGLPLIDKIMKHSYFPDQMSMLIQLINQNIPQQYASQYFGTSIPSGFTNIPLGKGLGLDIQQGGYMGHSAEVPFPVDYGIRIKKKF